MSGTHGELFMEIGKMVLAAHAGQAIDLTAKSEDLAQRYRNLNVPPETIAKAIARSLGAIGMSMAIVSQANGHSGEKNGHVATAGENGHAIPPSGAGHVEEMAEKDKAESPAKSSSALFPSGVRLAVLS